MSLFLLIPLGTLIFVLGVALGYYQFVKIILGIVGKR